MFGSVTCLRWFTLFRLCTPDTHKPLLISNQIILDYSQNRIDTLYMKNLLHLGEDQYLTMLLLKHFLMCKTRFIWDAHAETVAPMTGWLSSHNVIGGSIWWFTTLVSSCSWINCVVFAVSPCALLSWWILCWHSFSLSPLCTYDNLFVREFDYLTCLQIVYLIVSVMYEHKTVPLISLIMIGAVYGLQALVFVLRHKWDMVGWMVFYILASRSCFQSTHSSAWMTFHGACHAGRVW